MPPRKRPTAEFRRPAADTTTVRVDEPQDTPAALEPGTGRAARAHGAMARVVEYASRHPRTLLHLADVCSATGLTEAQAQSAINNARKAVEVDGKHLGSFDTQVAGRAWIYNPPAAQSAHRLFEQIGEAKDGTVILQAEDGDLYLARVVTSAGVGAR